MKVSEGSSFLWLISHALAFVFFSPSRTIFMVKLSSASRSPSFKGRGGVGSVLSCRRRSYRPHPCPSPAWEGSGCAMVTTDGLLVTDGGLARYGRCARSLRTVGSLVADGALAHYGRTGRSSRTEHSFIADGRDKGRERG